jgi:hypothetical protein
MLAARTDVRPGGSTAPTKTELIALARLVLDNCGVAFGTRKIFRLVDQFKDRAPSANGYVFFQFLANSVQMSEQQQRTALLNPDVARVIAYADPTGETAVNNVMRRR